MVVVGIDLGTVVGVADGQVPVSGVPTVGAVVLTVSLSHVSYECT